MYMTVRQRRNFTDRHIAKVNGFYCFTPFVRICTGADGFGLSKIMLGLALLSLRLAILWLYHKHR